MNEAVILERMEGLCALGDLSETARSLIEGRSAIIGGPCCDLPIAFAPFPDVTYRQLPAAARALGTGLIDNLTSKQATLFVFCAAKGDLSGLSDPHAPVPPILDLQARMVADILGLKPLMTIVVSNACASGAVALEIAREHLLDGRFSEAVLFGFDVISPFVAKGFFSLNALSRDGARPFDARRDGLTPGDCAALAVLRLRQARPGDIAVVSAATTNDANHRTGPSRTGEGLFRAAQQALNGAGLTTADIGAVKCHGTATSYNDAMEAKAIYSLFAQDMPPCFSVKGAIGHGSGAGSLLEVLLAAQFLQRGLIPPTAGFSQSGVEEPLRLSGSAQHIDKNKAVLCLSAGFGGLNAAVVIAGAPS